MKYIIFIFSTALLLASFLCTPGSVSARTATNLLEAVQERDRDAVHKYAKNPYNLFSFYGSRNRDSKNPLLFAAEAGYWDFVDLLLKYGAYAGIQDSNQNILLFFCFTPRHDDLTWARRVAAITPNLAHTNKEGYGLAHLVVARNQKDLDKLLYALELFPWINYRDKYDSTPLIRALETDHPWMAKALLELGADPTLVTDTGKSLLRDYSEEMDAVSFTPDERAALQAFKERNLLIYDPVSSSDLPVRTIRDVPSGTAWADARDGNQTAQRDISLIDRIKGFFTGSDDRTAPSAPFAQDAESQESLISGIIDTIRDLGRSIRSAVSSFGREKPEPVVAEREDLSRLAEPPHAAYGPAAVSHAGVQTVQEDVQLSGTIELQGAGEQAVFVLLTDSGKRLWIRNPDTAAVDALRAARARKTRVTVRTSALRLTDQNVALEGKGLVCEPPRDVPLPEERLERELIWDSPAFSLAAALLRVSEQAVLDSLEPAKRAERQASFDQWAAEKFETAVQQHMQDMVESLDPDLARALCVARVQLERADTLIAGIAQTPENITSYIGLNGTVDVSAELEECTITCSVFAESSSTVQGKAEYVRSFRKWLPVRNGNHADFYALFTNNKIYLVYEGTPETQGCPTHTHYFGRYVASN